MRARFCSLAGSHWPDTGKLPFKVELARVVTTSYVRSSLLRSSASLPLRVDLLARLGQSFVSGLTAPQISPHITPCADEEPILRPLPA
jgi:hypothetical protein